MNLRPLITLTLAVAFNFVATNALAGEDLSKPAVRGEVAAVKVETAKKEVSPAKPAPRAWWRRTSDQPCDSSTCRPFRFAWSPVAPGA